MDIKIKNLTKGNEKDLENLFISFKTGYMDRVCNPDSGDFISSFYFSNRKLFFRKVFSKEEDLQNLLKFCNTGIKLGTFRKDNFEDFDKFWQLAAVKLDRFILDIVHESPAAFIFDKRLSIYARRALVVDHIKFLIKEDRSQIGLLYHGSHLINIVKKNPNTNLFSGVKSFNIVELLSDSFIKEFYIDRGEIESLFGKDIINSIIKAIHDSSTNIDEIDKRLFMSQKKEDISNKMDFYLEQTLDIAISGSFYRKRKALPIKSITKRNFSNFISIYLLDQVSNEEHVSLIDYINKKKVVFKDFRPSHNKDFFLKIHSIVKYINCDLSFNLDPDYHISNSTKGFAFYSDSTSFLKSYFYRLKYLGENIDISKFINAKKYSFSTKKMFLDNTALLNFLIYKDSSLDSVPRFKKLFISTFDNLKELGVNEKTIRGFFSKFLSPQSYFYSKEGILSFNSFSTHNIIQVALRVFMQMVTNMVNHKFINKNFLNSLIRLISDFNLDETSLKKLHDIIMLTNSYHSKINELKDFRLKKISEYFLLLSSFKEAELKERTDKIYEHINVSPKAIQLSQSMNRFESYLTLLEGIYSRPEFYEAYREDNFIKEELLVEGEGYNVSITPHNSDIGLLGANVPGVCISPYGNDRLNQVSKEFLNLSVYSEDNGIMLWGLLCRATNPQGKSIYILNNLQGSVSKRFDSEVILENIYELMNMLISDYNIENVLFLDNGFNSLRLSSKFFISPSKKKYSLNKKVRLDFSINNSFYGLVE